jgi:hypothetical protein
VSQTTLELSADGVELLSRRQRREIEESTPGTNGAPRDRAGRFIGSRSRENTRLRLAEYVRSRGGYLIDQRLVPKQSFASIICFRHGLQRVSIGGAPSKRALWCARCKGDRLSELHRLPYEKVKRTIESYGWQLLTSKADYRNAAHIATKCPQGHRSVRTLHSLRRGRGCRSCYGRVGENAVRAVFQQLFGHEFPLRRPQWLRTSRGGNLELDGYCVELKLAFEYQGFMHSRRTHRFEGTTLSEQHRRDAEKAQRCVQNGVALVKIDEIDQSRLSDAAAVTQHVVNALINCGLSIATVPEIQLPTAPYRVRRLEDLGRVSRSLGLEPTDDVYRGVDYRYEWQCNCCNRRFRGSAYYRLKGRGCPLCWRQRRAEGTCWTNPKSRAVHVAK